MGKKCKTILVIISLLMVLFLVQCASTPTTTTTLIMFDDKNYSATNPVDIQVYKSRLELPAKYLEIGTIKFEGNPKIKDIKKQAAEKGAMALILDGNNYILIRLENKKEEESDETKTI